MKGVNFTRIKPYGSLIEVLVPSKSFKYTVLGSSILRADSPQNSKLRSGTGNELNATAPRKLRPSGFAGLVRVACAGDECFFG